MKNKKEVKKITDEILTKVKINWTSDLDLSIIFSFYWLLENNEFIFNPNDIYENFKSFVEINGIQIDRDIRDFSKVIFKNSENNNQEVDYFSKDDRFIFSFFLNENGIDKLEKIFPTFSFKKFFDFAQENS